MTMQKLFLTFFGSGLFPKAPGTAGTLASLPLGWAIAHYISIESLLMVTLAITIIGIFEINKYEKTTGTHDHQIIVIDETAGVWLTMVITHYSVMGLHTPWAVWLGLGLSFVSFRLFDIWKPSTIGWIDRELGGGAGVMLDDVLAGLAAGLLNALLISSLGSLLTQIPK
jgi:phosphatidylglycerophosphatase A